MRLTHIRGVGLKTSNCHRWVYCLSGFCIELLTMLRNNTSIVKKLKRCRLNTSRGFSTTTTTTTTTSKNKKSNYDSSPTSMDQTGQHLVRNIEDDGYGRLKIYFVI